MKKRILIYGVTFIVMLAAGAVVYRFIADSEDGQEKPSETLQKSPQGFNFNAHVGVVYTDERGNLRFAVEGPDLPVDTHFTIVDVGGPKKLLDSLIVAKLTDELDSREGTSFSQQTGRYSIKTLRGDDLYNGMVAIGVVDIQSQPVMENDFIKWDLDKDGVVETFRRCFSSEGISLSIWSGEPLKGRKRWDGYFYLGYDLEKDCTEEDAQEVAQ